jgi:hypothetical protein
VAGAALVGLIALGLAIVAVATTPVSYDLAGAQEVRSTLDPLPQAGLRLGAADAPVTITAIEDVACPSCRSILQRELPPGSSGAWSGTSSSSSSATGTSSGRRAPAGRRPRSRSRSRTATGSTWRCSSAIAGRGRSGGRATTSSPPLARETGADVEEWKDTFGDTGWERREWREHLRRSEALARENGIERPPGYVVDGPGGRRVVGPGSVTPAALERAVGAVREP